MAIKVELWKRDGTTYWHNFAQANEAVCCDAWAVKEGVPCPFPQATTVGAIGEVEQVADGEEIATQLSEHKTATKRGKGNKKCSK